jgi:hypothetical protein
VRCYMTECRLILKRLRGCVADIVASVLLGGCISADQTRPAARQKPGETEAGPLRAIRVDSRTSDDRWALQGGSW